MPQPSKDRQTGGQSSSSNKKEGSSGGADDSGGGGGGVGGGSGSGGSGPSGPSGGANSSSDGGNGGGDGGTSSNNGNSNSGGISSNNSYATYNWQDIYICTFCEDGAKRPSGGVCTCGRKWDGGYGGATHIEHSDPIKIPEESGRRRRRPKYRYSKQ